MPKIVINTCFGGFSISKNAAAFMAARGNTQALGELEESKRHGFHGYGYGNDFSNGYPRDDSDLVAAVETLGKEANGHCAELKIVEIPEGVEWEIADYDGKEAVEEKHRKWY